MMKLGRAALIGAVVLAAAVQPVAEAASPKSGRLLRSRPSLQWSGGPFWASEPNYLSTDCLGGENDPICDHYMLTVSLGEGAQIQISVKTPSPNPADGAQPLDGDDYDLFVYSPNGALVAEAANSKGNEVVSFVHRARYNGKPYEVRVHPWFVRPGSRYRGTARALTFGY